MYPQATSAWAGAVSYTHLDVYKRQALFLAGKDKGVFLHSFGADIFFDDQQRHCDSAREYVATGHVPFGVKN